jgi:hypothetical protein
MSDSTPTERFDAQPTTAATPRPNTLMWVLIGVGGALFIALVIVLILALTNPQQPNATAQSPVPSVTSSETPSALPSENATPVATPTASQPDWTPEPTQPEPSWANSGVPVPTFDSFHAQPYAGCQAGDTQRQLTFSWSSENAVRAYIGVQTLNAKAAPYESGLPPVYTYTNLYYNCDQNDQYYTVTLEDADGNLTHKTVTIHK